MVDDLDELINRDKFYQIVLIATASSIDAALDSMDMHSVVMVGFSISTLEMV